VTTTDDSDLLDLLFAIDLQTREALDRLFARFPRVILEDFEFISVPGERPDVVCMVFHDLSTGQTTRLWRNQLTDQLPYDDDTLVVSFVFNAEGACHLSLGQPLPKNVLDLSPEFKCHVNGKGIPRKNQGLIGALQYFGLDSIAPKRKDAMRARIMKGWPFTAEERAQILDYCAQDVEMLRQLLLKMLPHIDLPIALHRGEFVAALARSEHVGVPVDMEVFSQLSDKKTWRELRDSMVPLVDVHGVYVCDKLGEWHFNTARFEELLAAEEISWPRKEDTGKIDLRRKTFDSMAKAYPQIEPLRQLRYIRDKLRSIQLSVGHDHRNALAILVEDIADAAEGKALDIFAVGMVAVPDQAAARKGARLHRLFEHGIRGGRGAVGRAHGRTQPDARTLRVRRPLSEFR
jgi:hypothetical protein